MPAMRRFKQAQSSDRVRQFVEVLHHALHAGVDEPAQRRILITFAEDKSWNIVEQAGAPQAVERLARMFLFAAMRHDALEKLEDYVFFPGTRHVGTDLSLRINAEEIPRFVNRLRADRQNKRPLVAELIGVGN